MLPIIGSGGEFIKSIQSVTLSATTATAGSFGVTATRALCGLSLGLANSSVIGDWSLLGFPKVPDDSCLMMVISIQIGLQYDGSDPSRIAAQVVSGVGFLGAGTIMVKGGDVKGLTTAATLWVNAGIGMAIGAGLYFAGIATGVIVLLALIAFGRLNFIQELDDDDDLPLEDEDEVSDDA